MVHHYMEESQNSFASDGEVTFETKVHPYPAEPESPKVKIEIPDDPPPPPPTCRADGPSDLLPILGGAFGAGMLVGLLTYALLFSKPKCTTTCPTE